ncbi:TrbG/VirB9 family P-type conjugative transfer protein [Magnetospira sp. QH-2]|uniref:TrbG/VirB9 family P-type conjugative transfer protein n=1 Tax=Magnetospira sp. (strain QH-2) TaxID=1288970 RepID=UPI0003E813FA|nr:TrbG/VirB9 family P-type conjugative transfer protein [Magnetospira sp. QH-2]CCQ75755.1 Conserved protein of unknown function. Putative DNA transformation compentancy [Magnetospira sp. QH-2]
MFKHTLIGAAVLALLAGAASAQTANKRAQLNKMAMPAKTTEIAKPVLKEQSAGKFIRPEDVGRAAGQTQGAWKRAAKAEAVKIYDICRDCFYPVVTREFMVTTIELSNGDEIKAFDLGDTVGFQVKTRGKSRLAIRPKFVGVDTNLNVYTKSGAVHAFYVSSESIKSKQVPHVVVRLAGRGGDLGNWKEIEEREILPPVAGAEVPVSETNGQPRAKVPPAMAKETNGPKEMDFDYVQSGKCNVHGDYGFGEFKVFGDKDLAPVQVFRNDCFTFIYYGPERWKTLELPTAYMVWDEVDEVVNTRVLGRHTLVVENVGKMITLKAGQKHLCIEYTGAVGISVDEEDT